MPNLSQKMTSVEKYLGTSQRETWSSYERQWLDMLVILSGIPLRRWPCYPTILNPKLGQIEQRAPAYLLWYKWRSLTKYCENGISMLYEAGRAYMAEHGHDDLPYTYVETKRREYAATPAARALLREATSPCYKDFAGEVSSKRGSISWDALPRALAERINVIGLARVWSSVQICNRLYSAFRGQWEEVAVTPPTYPAAIFYKRDW